MQTNYSRAEISGLLEKVLAEIGPAQFSSLRLMQLEKVVRSRDVERRLPGKTLLREVINQFRMARWPQTAPKRLNDRFRRF